MKQFLTILATVIISVALTLLVKRHEQKPTTATTPNSPPADQRFSQRRLALKDESAKLDADFKVALQTSAKTPAEAAASLTVYKKYCDAQANLFSRQEALYREKHDSQDDPVLIEQEEATTAWCNASKDLIAYSADPKNGFHIVGDETFANDGATYNRKFLAFRVACIRLVNANGAEATVNKLDP
jgi:hypothetical protein